METTTRELANISLFDFLGRPAGSELGKKVHAEAIKQKSPISNRKVDTKNYKGKIMTYTHSFLKEYFNENK